MFNGCFKGFFLCVNRVLQGCFRGVKRVLNGVSMSCGGGGLKLFMAVSMLFKKRLTGVSSSFKRMFNRVLRVFGWCLQDVSSLTCFKLVTSLG